MRFEDLTPEKIEQAKECKTADERLAFVKENGIELTGEQLDALAGDLKKVGKKESLMSPTGKHVWEDAGRTRPGEVWGNVWPDKEIRCIHCGKPDWRV